MIRVLPFLLILALDIYAMIECTTTEARDVRTLPKPLWILAILLLPLVGALGWLVAGRPQAPAQVLPPGRRTYGGQLAPDDDPEFLESLRQGNAERERQLRKWEDDLRREDETGE